MLLLYVFASERTVAAGFLILACCPGAPFGAPFTATAKGNVQAAVALVVMLAGSSAVLAPILLRLLTPLVASDESLAIDAARMVVILAAVLAEVCRAAFPAG
jgi:BASS family bile acid:Na+ symporter